MHDEQVTLLLCGDVMTGRGVDQILPHPGDPRLWEPHLEDARSYVELAERANGPIPRPVPFSWPWGEAPRVIDELAPGARVMNLETSVTRSDDVAVGKPVCYRMSPDNVECLTGPGPTVWSLANNHVLDFGQAGLQETLDTLRRADLTVAGAGLDASEAARPATVPLTDDGRVVVFAFSTESSGVSSSWAATPHRGGVNFLADLSDATTASVLDGIHAYRRADDVVVASIHWGSNWGYDVDPSHVRFAHRLVDGGVDVVHGHSSHHPRPVEIYQNKLILYGCGDTIDDYEGIGGHARYRSDLRLLYFASVEPGSGALTELRAVPFRTRRMRLRRPETADSRSLTETLTRIGVPFGTMFGLDERGHLVLQGSGQD